MPSIASPKGIAGQSMLHPNSQEMRFDMAATNRITPIDESEVAVNESAGSERSEPTRAVRRHLPDERRALTRSEEHTSELQSLRHLVCRLLLEKKNQSLL